MEAVLLWPQYGVESEDKEYIFGERNGIYIIELQKNSEDV